MREESHWKKFNFVNTYCSRKRTTTEKKKATHMRESRRTQRDSTSGRASGDGDGDEPGRLGCLVGLRRDCTVDDAGLSAAPMEPGADNREFRRLLVIDAFSEPRT